MQQRTIRSAKPDDGTIDSGGQPDRLHTATWSCPQGVAGGSDQVRLSAAGEECCGYAVSAWAGSCGWRFCGYPPRIALTHL